MTASSVRPVALRHGAGIEDPLTVVLGFLQAPGRFDVSDPSRPVSFGEPDLRLANRGGARISAAQIAVILQRRGLIERALRDIPSGASLSGEVNSVPWLALRQLFGEFAGIRGVGLSKMTKALCFMQKFALCNEPAMVAGRSPAPIARAGPKGLHSRVGFA